MQPPGMSNLVVRQQAELAPIPDLSPELRDSLLERVRAGHFLTRACDFVGIAKPTFHMWEKRARAGDAEYVDLFALIHAAEHSAEDAAIKTIRSGHKEWKALAWYLERRYPHWRDGNETDKAEPQVDPQNLAAMIRGRLDDQQLKELIEELDG